MSEDDDHILPLGPRGAAESGSGPLTRRLARVPGRLTRGLRRVRDSRIGGAVEGLVRSGADAAADALTGWLRDPEHVRALQSTLARVAQFGMERGFEKDPDARLLFDFADWIEAEHGRVAVAANLLSDSPLLDGTLFGLLEVALRPWDHDTSETRRRLERAQISLLRLLVRLASLETGEVDAARSSDPDVLLEAFCDPLVPERFHPLGARALGLPGAFEAAESAGGDAPRRAGPTGLQRFVPSMHDPATRFVAQSYVFFVQTYLTRAMLESFPDVLASLDALERDRAGDDGPRDDAHEAGIIDR